MANEYLKRTPVINGNRQTWTLSAWVKINNDFGSGDYNTVFSVAEGTSGNNSDRFHLYHYTNGRWVTTGTSSFSQVFTGPGGDYAASRDPASWMHICLAVDNTGSSLNLDRYQKFWINNVEYDYDDAGNNAQYANLAINARSMIHYIGNRDANVSRVFDGQMFDFYLVDGQFLTPEIFGYHKGGTGSPQGGSHKNFDPRPGDWLPRAPRAVKNDVKSRGGFGSNGCYLPMNHSNNYGADFHCTPNSILQLKDNLPQPKAEIDGGGNYTNALRNDPYKDGLVAALPLVSNGLGNGFGDYSAAIKGEGSPLVVTTSGSPAISQEYSVYYGSSAKLIQSNSQYIEVSGFDLNIGTGDFTIEAWYNFTSRPEDVNIFNLYEGTTRKFFAQARIANASVRDIHTRFHGSGNQYDSGDVDWSDKHLNTWYHLAACRKDGHFQFFINGECVTSLANGENIGNVTKLRIGYMDGDGSKYLNGYVQDVRFYTVAKYSGGFDCPKPWGQINFGVNETWRALSDSTGNNFSTLNSLYLHGNANTSWSSNITLSEGNLSATWTSGTGSNQHVRSTLGMRTGKWYFEAKLNSTSGGDVGIALENHINDSVGYGSDQKGYSYRTDGRKQNNTSSSTYGSSYGTSDIIGVAFDADNGLITFYKNGVSQGVAFSGINTTETAHFGVGKASSGSTQTASVNFGQNPSFCGNVTAGTYTDSNGVGLFKYEPPAGYLALCTKNITTTVKNPGDYFKPVTYRGSGSNKFINCGFQPDLVWIKERDSTSSHEVFDSVRKASNKLNTNTTNAETVNSNALRSFDENGFSVGLGGAVNEDAFKNYVAWSWKAGGNSNTYNIDGTGYVSTTAAGIVDGNFALNGVSINRKSGFSIATYTTNNSAGSFAHGLQKKPGFALFKAKNNTGNWAVYHQSMGTNTARLSTTDDMDTSANAFTSEPDENLFNLGTWAGVNGSNINWIAYSWAEIEGFSRFGEYIANGNANGPFVECGFKPAWIMIKTKTAVGSSCLSSGYNSWGIWDSSRQPTNPANGLRVLWANRNYEEGKRGQGSGAGSFLDIDLVSNGFKIRGAGNCETNSNGTTYIFVAFAESPFQTATSK